MGWLRWLSGNQVVRQDPVYGVDQASRVIASLGAVTNTVSPMSRGTAVLPIAEAKSGMVFPAMQNFVGATHAVAYPQVPVVAGYGQLPDQKSPDQALDAAAIWLTAGQQGLGSLGGV